MDLEIAGRVAVITGATAGIGRTTAGVLAAEGVRLALVGRRSEELDKLGAEIVAAGGEEPLLIPADVTDAATPGRVRAQVEEAFGGLDILVNNAGGAEPLGTVLTEEVWQQQFVFNFHQKRWMAEAFEDLLIASPQGRVINMAVALEPSGRSAAMSALAALHLWSKGYARYLGPHSVTVNCVSPGRIESEQLSKMFPDDESRNAFIKKSDLPLGRFGFKEEAADLIAFLASARSSYITGQAISIDGGLSRHI
ncbi:SDR family oxidoreductase [Microbacterium lacus]|uniref:SDR family NAD(P)-dependent oxidoreductase n=1 Tax=Microbacterium lacus TaxID=415217 RepID=UPI00384A5BAF